MRALLQNYCRHQAGADEMSELIDSFQLEWLKDAAGMRRYEWLVEMREKESRAAAQMATKLRLTNQSRYTNRAAASAVQDQQEHKPCLCLSHFTPPPLSALAVRQLASRRFSRSRLCLAFSVPTECWLLPALVRLES